MEKQKTQKEDIPRPKREKKPLPWPVTVTIVTFAIAFLMGIFADVLAKSLSVLPALLVLIFIVFIGVVADMAGLAIATADEKPLHAMAARKIGGAKEALFLMQNAEKATSIFNDVIGDIAGIISGATAATIGVYLVQLLPGVAAGNRAQLGEFLLLSVLSALVAALTVGTKAAGKNYAIKHAEKIVFFVGKLIHFWRQLQKPGHWFPKP